MDELKFTNFDIKRRMSRERTKSVVQDLGILVLASPYREVELNPRIPWPRSFEGYFEISLNEHKY